MTETTLNKEKRMTQEIRDHYTYLVEYRLERELASGVCECDGCTSGCEEGHDGLYSGQDIEIFNLGNRRVWVFREDINYIKEEK